MLVYFVDLSNLLVVVNGTANFFCYFIFGTSFRNTLKKVIWPRNPEFWEVRPWPRKARSMKTRPPNLNVGSWPRNPGSWGVRPWPEKLGYGLEIQIIRKLGHQVKKLDQGLEYQFIENLGHRIKKLGHGLEIISSWEVRPPGGKVRSWPINQDNWEVRPPS